MNRQGFSLIECMVYCMILAILFTTWFHGMVISCAGCSQTSKKSIELSDLSAAQNLLVRDIRQAPAERNQWKKISKAEVIWHTEDNDVGWCCIDNKLLRMQGTYNTKEQKWHNKKTGVVALHVDHIIFSNQADAHKINGVVFEIIMQNKQKVKRMITLCNGTTI